MSSDAKTVITPAPTEEEAVVVAAAVEALWPRPMVSAEIDEAHRVPAWRFSGRWWSRPLPARRNRPYR
jgi:hypothetical protein